jgi:hypothetical protein
MHDLGRVWLFTRERLRQSIEGLSDEEMRWRPHHEAHTIFEILFHIAGAEHYWASRLTGRDPAENDMAHMLDLAVKDGFLRDGACPFGPEYMNRRAAEDALELTRAEIEPVICHPTPEQIAMSLTSPVGDNVNGLDGLARLAQHAGYHTGQIWLMRMDPRFGS